MAQTVSWLINDAPFGVTFIAFFLGAFTRGNATYWVGRGIAKGVERTRFHRHLHGPVYRRAQKFIGRWGIFAVPLSFLTIGIQSAVNASAGISRMPLRRYLPAVALGALLWSLIYTTVGMAMFYAWLALDWPWVVAGLLVVGAVVLAVVRMRIRKQAAKGNPEPENSEINC